MWSALELTSTEDITTFRLRAEARGYEGYTIMYHIVGANEWRFDGDVQEHKDAIAQQHYKHCNSSMNGFQCSLQI